MVCARIPEQQKPTEKSQCAALKVAFFQNYDAVFPLPKKCAKNYPEQEILKLCYALCKQKRRQNSKYKA